MSSQRPGYGSGPAPAGDPRFQQATPPPDPFGEGFSWIMPKTVVSLAVWVLMFGLGAGLSGLMLFVFYQSEINDLRSELLESQQELRNTLEGQIEQIENAPGRSPEASLSVSQVGRDSEEVMARLTESVAPAVAGVRGRDQGLVGTSGSGFVVNSPGGSAWIVTNYSLVVGADPQAPNTRVRVRHIELSSEVYEVDPGNGLALMIYPDGVSRSLRIAGSPPAEGENLWAVGSSRSSPYAELVQAEVLSIEPNLIVEADVSESFAGGPVIDERGRVHGIIPTLTSAGSSSETVRFSVTPIDRVCQRILRCPGSGVDQASADDADATGNETEPGTGEAEAGEPEAQTGDGVPGTEQPPPGQEAPTG
ncbi:MAG: serine protease [Actinobacteria bacterium]|nr:serine protease [Actinomycetota bacterium]